MPSFAYTARDNNGAQMTGTLVAASLNEASQQLRAEGKYPTAVNPVSDSSGTEAVTPGRKGIKVKRAEVIQFTTQLSIMVETGVTLTEALDCIAEQATLPQLKSMVEDIARQVQGGSDFSSALSRHPRSFPRLFVSLIRASEKSGMMAKLLARGTAYLRDEQEIVRRVKGALTYPGIMLAFAVTTTIFLLAFVLPRFAGIYAAKSAALPLPTKILLNMSNFMTAHWAGLITGTLLAVVGGYFYFGTEGGKRVLHYIELNVPVIGAMFRKMHLARSLRMIGTMSAAGVNLVECVTTAHDLCSNGHFRALWNEVSEQIQTGKQLSEPLFDSPLVPRSISQMIHSAEKSGKLSFVLEQVAGYAEQELKDKIADLTRYIEPAMIIIMGVIIGGVAMALLLPIFTISRVVAN